MMTWGVLASSTFRDIEKFWVSDMVVYVLAESRPRASSVWTDNSAFWMPMIKSTSPTPQMTQQLCCVVSYLASSFSFRTTSHWVVLTEG
jgi:hypothetical protein